MSILTDFEDRVGGALEGMFAGVFRSPVQPVEIAKALGRAMDDGKTIGVGKVYAPGSYVVALSPQDSEKLGTFKATLAGELATFLADHAREHSYHLPGKPRVTFKVHRDLRLGRFRVSADLTSAPDDEPPSTPPLRAAAPSPERATAAPPAPSGVASVTVGEDGRRRAPSTALLKGRVLRFVSRQALAAEEAGVQPTDHGCDQQAVGQPLRATEQYKAGDQPGQHQQGQPETGARRAGGCGGFSV